jgi:hypothetical protein
LGCRKISARILVRKNARLWSAAAKLPLWTLRLNGRLSHGEPVAKGKSGSFAAALQVASGAGLICDFQIAGIDGISRTGFPE